MQGGPTVRRLHRDREQGARERVGKGAGRTLATPSGLRSSPTVRFRMLEAVHKEDGRATRSDSGSRPSSQGSARGQAGGHRAKAVCPVKVGALLGIGDREDVAVVGGVIIRLERTGARQADQKGEPVSVCKTVQATLDLHLAALRQWALTHRSSWRYTSLDRHGPRPEAGSSPRVARFVHDRVIPLLRARARVAVEVGNGAGEIEEEAGRERWGISPQQVLAGIDQSFALIGGSKYELVPFFGEPPKRHLLYLQLPSGNQFLGIGMEPRETALRRFDSALERVVDEALRPPGEGGSADLFCDEGYRVVRTPAGRYFVSQRCGDYCVEGRDGKLYQFDAVEFGLQIAGLNSSEVMTPFGVRIFRDRYSHMFVEDLGGTLALCMPKSDSYFSSLDRLPLEEALLHHLESARQTLCSGYTPGNSLYHPIHVLGRPTLTELEARQRDVPVYRYARSA